MADIDTTRLVNKLPPKHWKCPRCGAKNTMKIQTAALLAEYGRSLQHCERCNFLHFWRLEMSPEYLKSIDAELAKGDGLNG